MGYTYVDLVVRGRISRSVRALVDTGSTCMVLDSKTIFEAGLHETPFKVDLTLADKRKVKSRLYLAEVEAEGRKGPAFVAELDVPTPILGAYALETFRSKAKSPYWQTGNCGTRRRIFTLTKKPRSQSTCFK